MILFYPNRAVGTLLLLCLCWPPLTLLFPNYANTCASAQTTTLVRQGFEHSETDDWRYTTDPPTYSGPDNWTTTASLGGILPYAGDAFFGGQDINNSGGGRAGNNNLIFETIDVEGLPNVRIHFYYRVVAFDNGDDLKYTLTVDGVAGDEILLFEGRSDRSTDGWARADIAVPPATSFQLTVHVVQNGDDYFGLDAFEVTSNAAADPCGITALGIPEIDCLSESTDPGTDNFRITIPYFGVDEDAVLLVEAGATTPANDVSATTRNVGDDFRTVADGTIVLENTDGQFEEGDEVRITLTDGGGDCSFVQLLSTSENRCANPCDININVANIRYTCDATTDAADTGTARIAFTNGPEPGAVVSFSDPDARLSGDDPATDEDGTIVVSGLTEGDRYTLTVSGGGCTGEETLLVEFDFADGTCVANGLVINEINFDPYANDADDPSRDANGDGVVSGASDEFVELFNTTDAVIDLSGYRLSEETGVFHEFPRGTLLKPGSAYVVFGGAAGRDIGCPTAASNRGVPGSLGLNNGGDEVSLADADGRIVARASWAGDAPADQSYARSPDYDGDFAGHAAIAANPVPHSACFPNTAIEAALPVELLAFTGRVRGKQAVLEWSTAGEQAVEAYVIERSGDGRTWIPLERVTADGRGENAYRVVDDATVRGANHYRLIRRDLDGQSERLGTVVLDFFAEEFRVAPNPVMDELLLSMPVPATARVDLLTVDGRRLRRLAPGTSRLNVTRLRSGVYLLRVARPGGVETVRFLKQ